MKNACKVGFITTLSGRWPVELPQQRHKEYGDWLMQNLKDAQICAYSKTAGTPEDVQNAIRQFKTEEIDVLIMLYGAFTGDDTACLLAESLNVPLILWAPYELPFERDTRMYANAMCAATMNAAALKRIDKTRHVVYGNKEDEKAAGKLSALIDAYGAIKNLKQTHLGLFGYRPTGFYNSAFDESLIRKTFGIRIEETDLKVLFDRMEQVPQEKVSADIEKIKGKYEGESLPIEHYENHSKLYYALESVYKEQGYDYATIKCWPEMGALKTTPCAVLGRLADEGVHMICEGDVDVGIGLIVQNLLTGQPCFIADMIDADEQANLLTYWHCGNAPLSLYDEADGISLNNHPFAGQGTAFYGALKPGDVTVCRFCNIDGKYKLFLLKGEAVPTKRNTKGAMVSVQTKQPVREILDTIIDEGVAHHYSIVWEDVYEPMKMVATLLGIEVIEV